MQDIHQAGATQSVCAESLAGCYLSPFQFFWFPQSLMSLQAEYSRLASSGEEQTPVASLSAGKYQGLETVHSYWEAAARACPGAMGNTCPVPAPSSAGAMAVAGTCLAVPPAGNAVESALSSGRSPVQSPAE